MIGKNARCVKCREYFEIQLSKPLVSEEEEDKKEEDAQRSPEENEQYTLEKSIIKVFDKMKERLEGIVNSGKRNESEVRRWCIDFIKNALGYTDEEIETESKILGQRIDIALKKDNKVFMIIECKSANVSLTPVVRNQAARYAINVGAEWAVVTNGQMWKLYRITPKAGEEPDCTEIFDIFMFHEDGFDAYEAECLSLLTSQSIESGNTTQNAHNCACIAEKRLYPVIYSDKVIDVICKELKDSYEKEAGVEVEVDKEQIQFYLNDLFGELEV